MPSDTPKRKVRKPDLQRVREIARELPTTENMEELRRVIAPTAIETLEEHLEPYFLGVLEKHHGFADGDSMDGEADYGGQDYEGDTEE